VEWVLKPTIKLLNDEKFTNFSKFSPDGMSSFWDNDGLRDPTFIDLKGNTHTFNGVFNVGEFVQGIAPAVDTKAKKWGYIDFSGNWVCKPELSSASDIMKYYLTDGSIRYYALAEKNGVRGYVGLDGKFVDDWEGTVDIEKTCGPKITPPKLAPGLDIMGSTNGGLFTFIKHMAEGQGMAEGNYFGICDKDGNIILEPTYFPNGTQNLHSSYMSGETYDDCIVLTHKLT
ncbi:MAG: WG repeat-containing protein, partial [Bacteroides sp.]